MAHPQIAVFARLADKNAQPVRKIEGQKTLMGRTMHGFSYDEIHDEITVTQEFGQAILTFPGGANGETAPIRVIQGSKTGLVQPDRVAVDADHGGANVRAAEIDAEVEGAQTLGRRPATSGALSADASVPRTCCCAAL